LRVGDKPGDYVDKAMLDLLFEGVSLRKEPTSYGTPVAVQGTYVKSMNEAAEDIASRTHFSKDAVMTSIETWNGTMAEHMSPKYYGLKRGIAEEFGLEDTLPDWFRENERKLLSGPGGTSPEFAIEQTQQTRIRRYEHMRSVGRNSARAMYEDSQKRLSDAGITEVTLYRGHVSEASRKLKVGDTTGVTSTSASSWSLSPNVASGFADDDYALGPDNAGVVLQATVPASRILSWPGVGFGTYDEYEVVVLEDPIAEDKVKVTERYTQ
jgi:hypothetical protein